VTVLNVKGCKINATRAWWVVLSEKINVFYNLYYVKTTKYKLDKWY